MPDRPSAPDKRQALPPSLNRMALPVLPGALCKGQDPDLWFSGSDGSLEAAKAVCRACPARARCLEWAVQAGERAGVWGGTSPDERAPYRPARGQPDQGAWPCSHRMRPGTVS